MKVIDFIENELKQNNKYVGSFQEIYENIFNKL